MEGVFIADAITRAILTMFQIEDAAQDPVTRTAALVSLVCALMSLCYGVLFIVRFGTMRSMYKAFRWADVRFSRYKPSIALLNIHCTGSAKDTNIHPLELLGAPSDAGRLARLVYDLLCCRHPFLRLAYRCCK